MSFKVIGILKLVSWPVAALAPGLPWGGASCQLLPTVKRHGEVAPRNVGTGSSSANSSEPRNLTSIQAFWLRFGGLRPAGMT